MNDRMPPLTALRAFEAAARHMSFARAADELSVTPAALSFQIKSLETHLGQPVFRRLNRAVELTPIGEKILPGLRDGFDQLNGAWRVALRARGGQSLTITAGPAITAKWLAPRLYDFARAHPEIELRFAASIRRMDFARDDVDAAIRFGYGPDPGLFSHSLKAEAVSPAMVPSLAKQFTTPESLLKAPLIVDESIDFLRPTPNWQAWFRAAGIPDAKITGARFTQADHALDAALSGVGVILARRSLAAHDLLAGHLTAPFDLALSTRAHVRFLCPDGTENRPEIQAFLKWLIEESQIGSEIWNDKQFTAIETMT